MTEDQIAKYYGDGFKEPIVALTISEEFIRKHGPNIKEIPYLGVFIIDDALDCTIGPYRIELRFWNKEEEDRQKESEEYEQERGLALDAKQGEERSEDFKRWKKERQQQQQK